MTITRKILFSIIVGLLAIAGIFIIVRSGQSPKLDTAKTVTIKKGKHAASPHWWSYKKREVFSVRMTPDASVKYNFKNADQLDWNKLVGLSYNFFTNHKNSAMVSWRWGVKCDCVEYGFYYHISGKRVIAENGDGSEVFITGKPGEEIEIVMSLNRLENSIFTTILTSDNSIADVRIYGGRVKVTAKKSRVINPWFGGNQKAPHSMSWIWGR